MIALPLSPVDYIFTGTGSQPITFAFSYLKKIDPEILRNSLYETLQYFPVLRSRLHKVSENEYEFLVAEDGLTFDTTESDADFEQSGRIEQYITPVTSSEGNPLTKIAVTQTPKGSVLGVSISHALVDGFSYFHFLSSWARICRGDRIMQPSFDRDLILSRTSQSPKPVTVESIYDDCGLFYGAARSIVESGHINTERIVIPDETIRSCLEDAKQQHNISLTENDVITALIWRRYIPLWHKGSNNPLTYVTCPFDFRRVMPGFPKTYFGCALCFATASIDSEALVESSTVTLAMLIKSAVSRVKNDYILNSLFSLESFRRQYGLAAMEKVQLRHPQHGMIVTNLSRLPVRDIDFGYGSPAHFLTYAEVPGSAAILPAATGAEVLVIPPLI